MGGQRTTGDDWLITSDNWLPEYQEECPETPEFPSGPAPFSGDGAFDAPIPSMNPSLRLPVSYDTYLKGIDHCGGGSGLAAEPIPQDRHSVLHGADSAIKGELHENKRLCRLVLSGPDLVSDDSAVQADAESMSLDYIVDYYNSNNDSICFPQQAAEVDALELSNNCESISERSRDMNLAPSRQGVQQVDLLDCKYLAPVVPFDGDTELVATNESDTVYIDKPEDWDIVAGRGGEGNYHPGNKWFRKTVTEIHPEYTKNITRPNKTKPSKHIVEGVNNYGGATDVLSDTKVAVNHESDTGYVDKPGKWDILADRGGEANHHKGNKRFRRIVSRIQPEYTKNITRPTKTKLSKYIVEYVNDYGGRFLKKDSQGGYFIMSKEKAREKTSQALRDGKGLKWTHVDVEENEAFYEEAKCIAEEGQKT